MAGEGQNANTARMALERLEDASFKPALLSPLPPKHAGRGADETILRPEHLRAAPPPLVCKPVLEAPPPEVFITWESLKRYSYLARLVEQAGRPARATPGPAALPPTSSDSESEGVVTSDPGLHRMRAGHAPRGEQGSGGEQRTADKPGGAVAATGPLAVLEEADPDHQALPEADIIELPRQDADPDPGTARVAVEAGSAEGGTAAEEGTGVQPQEPPPQQQHLAEAGAKSEARAERKSKKRKLQQEDEGGGQAGEHPHAPGSRRERRGGEQGEREEASAAAQGPPSAKRKTRSSARLGAAEEAVAQTGEADASTQPVPAAPADDTAAVPSAQPAPVQPSLPRRSVRARSGGAADAAAATAARPPAAGGEAKLGVGSGNQQQEQAQQRDEGPEQRRTQRKGRQQQKQQPGRQPASSAQVAAGPRAGQRMSDSLAEAALRLIGEEGPWNAFAARLAREHNSSSGGGVKCVAHVHIQDVLNPVSKVYHAAFAEAYKQCKAGLDKKAISKAEAEELRQHSQLLQRWSALTPAEHQWYLEHQEDVLLGPEAKRMAALREAVVQEQEEWRTAALSAAAKRGRLVHCTPRQTAQLHDDAAARRERVRALPRLYRLQGVVPLPVGDAATPPAGESRPPELLLHLAELARRGAPPLVEPPPAGATLPGDKLYLPAAVHAGDEQQAQAQQQQQEQEQEQPGTRLRTRAGAASAAGTAGAAVGSLGLYRKAAELPLAVDPRALQLVEQLVAQTEEEHQQQEQEQEQQGHEGGLPAVFCLAASALTAVGLSAADVGTSWELPITITDPQPGDKAGATGDNPGGGSGSGSNCSGCRRVFIEKPLLPRMATMRQQQRRLQKYAWLSAAVLRQQPRQAQTQQVQQQDQQAGQQQQDAEKEDEQMDQGTGAGGVAPRQACYRHFRLGARHLLVRSHNRLLVRSPPGGAGSAAEGEAPAGVATEAEAAGAAVEAADTAAATAAAAQALEPVVLLVREQYLAEPDREGWTPAQRAACAYRLLVDRQAAAVLVAEVDVPRARALGWRWLGRNEVVAAAGGGEATASLLAAGARALLALLVALERLPAGRYLATHAAGDGEVALFKALPATIDLGEGQQVPLLPAAAAAAKAAGSTAVFDLHAAHARSTEVVPPNAQAIVPPEWRPFRPDIPQIEFTFPPKPSSAAAPQDHKQKKKGGKKVGGKRPRGLTPLAWKVLGKGGDFDAHEELGDVTAEDYRAALDEELD